MGKEQETRSDSSQCCSTKFLLTNSSSRVIFVGWSLGILCKRTGCCCAQSLYVIIVRALNVLHDTRGCVSVPTLKLYSKILHLVHWLVHLLTVWFAYCNMVRVQTIVILRLKKSHTSLKLTNCNKSKHTVICWHCSDLSLYVQNLPFNHSTNMWIVLLRIVLEGFLSSLYDIPSPARNVKFIIALENAEESAALILSLSHDEIFLFQNIWACHFLQSLWTSLLSSHNPTETKCVVAQFGS